MLTLYIEHKLWTRRDWIASRLLCSGNTYTYIRVYRKELSRGSLQQKTEVSLATC